MPPQKLDSRTVEGLITTGLGYCCEYAFFSLYRRAGLIAARLGVSRRAVQYHLHDFREGYLECCEKPNCMKRLLKR